MRNIVLALDFERAIGWVAITMAELLADLFSLCLALSLVVNGAEYNESVSCEDFPEVANLSLAELQREVNK